MVLHRLTPLLAALCLAGPAWAELGTAVSRWDADVAAAGSRALAEDKLLLVLDVSGQFEDPGFT